MSLPLIEWQVYDEMKMIPLICAKGEEKATAVSTFMNYASGWCAISILQPT